MASIACCSATPENATDAVTGVPLGQMACPSCDVSWGFGPLTCWICGEPGISSAEAKNRAERSSSTP
jgi:hypothetical protein